MNVRTSRKTLGAIAIAAAALASFGLAFGCAAPDVGSEPGSVVSGDPTANSETAPGGTKTEGPGNAPPAPSSPTGPRKTDLFHRTFGDPNGQAVIYLNGGPGGNGAMFEETLAVTLSKSGHYAIAYDQRGSGRSPKATKQDFTYAKFAQDLDDLIHTLELKTAPILIGHSWGGTLGVKYMELHPGVAKGTILVGNPVDYPDSLFNIHERCSAIYRMKIGKSAALAEIAQLHTQMFPNGLTPPYKFPIEAIGATMSHAMDAGLYFPSLTNAFGFATTWARLLVTGDRDLLMGVERSVSEAFHDNEHLFESDFNKVWTEQRANLYAIYGDQDGLFSTKQLAQIKSIVTPEHFTLVQGASHMVFVDKPAEFDAAFAKYEKALTTK